MGDQLPGLTGLPPMPTRIGNDIRMAMVNDPDALRLPSARLNASDSLKCARQIGFKLLGVPKDLSSDWDPQKGNAIDRVVKQVIRAHGGIADVPFDFLPDFPFKGIGDGAYQHPDGASWVGVEAKSGSSRKMNGVSGMWRNTPPGPDAAWLAQCGELALANGYEFVHIIGVDDENPDRDPLEWVLGLDDELPHIDPAPDGKPDTVRRLATREVRRQARILSVCDTGTLPTREIPGVGIVNSPPSAADSGNPWQCRYCAWQPSCAALGAGEIVNFRASRAAA